MRWTILLLLIMITACSSPSKVEITGTPVANFQLTESAEGYLMIILNPINDWKVSIRNVEVFTGQEWLKLSDGVLKNSKKPILLGKTKLPKNFYHAIRFTFDSAVYNNNILTTPFPHVTIPFDFEVSKEFTVLSLDLLSGESVKNTEMFFPFFRIEVLNALDVEVKTDNSVELFDTKLVNTLKVGMNKQGNFFDETKNVKNVPSRLDEDPKPLQIDETLYLKQEPVNNSLKTIKLSVSQDFMNPKQVMLTKNEGVNLIFTNVWGKLLGVSIVELNKSMLLKPGEDFYLQLTPQEETNYNVKCVDPCWRKEGTHLGFIKIEKPKEFKRYN